MKIILLVSLALLAGCALNIGSGSSRISGQREWDGDVLDLTPTEKQNDEVM